MAEVDVTDVEAGALTRQAARPEGREPALVSELIERVRLLHELRELRAAEELLDRGDDRTDVDELLRRRLLGLDDGHPLADHALHAQQTDAELTLDELADGAHPAVAEMVDVVRLPEAAVQLDDPRDDLHQVVVRERARLHRQVEAELAIQLVAADLREVVAPEVEEERVHEVAGVVDRGRVARPETLVDLDQTLVRVLRRVLVEGRCDVLVLRVEVHAREERLHLFARRIPDRAQKRGDRQLALAVHLHRDDVLVRRFELEPCAAVRDELRVEQLAARRRVVDGGEVHAGRPHELADDNALGAVDHEGALVGHPREVAEEDVLLGDLTGLLVHELDARPQRLAKGEVARAALLFGVLGLAELAREEAQVEVLTGEVLDRRDLLEQLAKALIAEPFERIDLRLDEVGERQDLWERCVVATLALDRGRGGAVEGQGHSGPSSELMARGRAERQRIDGG